MRRAFCAATIVCIAVPCISLSLLAVTPAAAAPQQLYNKSITVHWGEGVLQKASDGSTRTPQISSTRVIYVSSAGRLFVKGTRSINNRRFQATKTTMRGPDGSSGMGNVQGNFGFSGNQLVGTAVFDGGARRLTVSFDPSFSSCTASVIYGKSGGGNQKWQSLDGSGQTFEVISITVNAVSCSISEGNAVAG